MQDQNASPLANIFKTPFEGFNRFILADLREGRLSLEGLSFPLKVLILIGFAILIAAAFMMILFDPIRQNSEILSLQNTNLLARGSSVATLTIPLTLFLTTCATAYILTGAIRIRRLYLVLILLYFYGSISPFVLTAYPNLLLNITVTSILVLLLSTIAFFAIPIFMFVRRRWRESQPVYEFVILFFCSALVLQTSQFNLILADTVQNQEFTSITVDSYFSSFTFLVLPFFLQIGMEIAKFVRKLSFWSVEILHYRFSRRFQVIYFALGAITIWQLFSTWSDTVRYFQENNLQSSILGYLGAAAVVLFVWLTWWGMKRVAQISTVPFQQEDEIDEQTNWLVFPAIGFALNLALIPIFILLFFPVTIGISILFELDGVSNSSFGNLFQDIEQVGFSLIVATFFVTTIWGIRLARQQNLLSAVYISLFGTLFLWNNLTQVGRPLPFLEWSGSVPVDFWWSLLLFGFICYWLWRRELTNERAISLLILSLANTLIFRQQDFIEEPLYLLLEYSGTGMITFGVIWDSITVGNWANENTPALPRISRIFLYLGYVLLALGVILWAMGQRDYFFLDIFTGDGALLGVQLLGRPMIFMLFPLLLTLPKDQLPISESNVSN